MPSNIETGSGNLTAFLKRGNMALEDKEWETADSFFERALNFDAECAEAYIGKLLAQENCSSIQEFVSTFKYGIPNLVPPKKKNACPEDNSRIESIILRYAIPNYFESDTIRRQFGHFSLEYMSELPSRRAQLEYVEQFFKENKLWMRARRFAKGIYAELLQQVQDTLFITYQNRIKQAIREDQESIQRIQTSYQKHLDEIEQQVIALHLELLEQCETDYTSACKVLDEGTSLQDFQYCITTFEKLLKYRDSSIRISQCQRKIEELTEVEQKHQKRKKYKW